MQEKPKNMRSDQIKGLNGMRALCALCILWGHISQRDFCQWEITSLPLPDSCAYVFFVISGFLAGFRMDQTLGLLPYYKKKIRRILPLYYSYLIIAILTFVVLGQSNQVLNSQLWYYLLLVPQIPFSLHSGLLPLVHLWFIGTIVLFYIVFPFFARLKEKEQVFIAAIFAALWFLFKMLVRIWAGAGSFGYHLIAITSFDVLFAGVWAGLLFKRRNRLICRMTKMTWLGVTAWLLFLCSGVYAKLIPAPLRIEYIAFLALIIIITQQKESFYTLLDNRLFNWLGSISYEIYVTHIIVIILLSRTYSVLSLVFPSVFIYIICTVIVVGIAWSVNKALGYVARKH